MAADERRQLVESYDRCLGQAELYFDDRHYAGYANLGLFLADTRDQTAACENLMEHLLALVPSKQGRILDVGCGVGGSTRHLTRYYSSERVHAINISAAQLEACRERVPGAHLYLMAAEQMAFADQSFETVISVEAACHFQRDRFLTEAWRVLRPGGALVLADILFHQQPRAFSKVLRDQEIHRTIGEYQARIEHHGFVDVRCEDSTRACWRGFVEHLKKRALHGVLTRAIDARTFERLVAFAREVGELPVSAYVLTSARASK
jgi:cyclopropane fatty-acyl-phospholipid synthase-like methyltransferase